MGRAPCCDKANVKKGPWSPEEDTKLKEYIDKYGTGGNWIALPQKAGLKRCGKSCRLRWLNYLRPNIKHGDFTDDEDRIICSLFANIGSRWSIIAAQLPGRTDNDIKNYWNTKLKKKLMAVASQSQRKPPPFPQASTLVSHSLSSLCSESNFSCYPHARSLTGFDPISQIPSSLLGNNTSTNQSTSSSSFFQTPEGLDCSMQYYPLIKDNMLVFGSEASCSSNSDGSCSQISYGREIKQEEMGLVGYISNGFEENNQKFIISYGSNCVSEHENFNQWGEKTNGYFGEATFDLDIEEVKHILSSSNPSGYDIINNNHLSSILIDENKTQNRDMYYYSRKENSM